MFEGGSFQMGASSDDTDASEREKPLHWVEVSDFYISETQVTQALWKKIMKSNPCIFKGDDLPAENVAWMHDNVNVSVHEFICRLNNALSNSIPQGYKFQLPTEAEWEYAARGGLKTKGFKYSGSNNIDDVAWNDASTYFGKTHSVKSRKANELGLYDMSGNVWEWCLDYWKDNYNGSEVNNPTGPKEGSGHVIRGGSCYSVPNDCRVSCRYFRKADICQRDTGFRLVLVHE